VRNADKIVHTIVLAQVFLIPLFSWNKLLFAYTLPKTLLFIALTEIAFIFWLASSKITLRSLVSYSVLAFFIIAVIASVFGQDLNQSVFSNYERMMGLWTHMHMVLFFLIIATSFNSDVKRLLLLRTLVVSASIVSFIGAIEFYSGDGAVRVVSTLDNSAFLATYLVLASFASMYLAVNDRMRLLWVAASTLLLFGIIITGTRGAILSILLTYLAILVLTALHSKQVKIRNYTWSLIAVAVISGVLFIVFRDSLAKSSFDPVSRLATISFSDSSVRARLLAWQVGFEGWKEAPILGWGVENYNILFNTHYDALLIDNEPWFDRAHNIIVDTASTTGIAGLVAYLAIYISAIWLLLTSWRKDIINFWIFLFFSGALMAHIIQNMFVFDTIASFMLFYVFLALIHSWGSAVETYRFNKKWPVAGIAVLVLFMLYSFVWRPMQEARIGQLARIAFAMGQDAEAIELTEKALSYDTYGDIDVRRAVAEYVFDFLKAGGYSGRADQLRNEEKMKSVMNYAIEMMEQNIKDKPKDVKWYMYQGELYNLGAFIFENEDLEYAANAKRRFLESRILSPNRPQILLELAQANSVLSDREGVWASIEEAKQIAPEYLLVRYNALSHAIRLGDRVREEKEIVSLRDGSNILDYATIVNAYYENARYADAIKFQEEYTKLTIDITDDPVGREEKFGALYKDLAALYKLNGELVKAKNAALTAMEYNPDHDFQIAGQLFIQSLNQ
jgi:O-antigen ligase